MILYYAEVEWGWTRLNEVEWETRLEQRGWSSGRRNLLSCLSVDSWAALWWRSSCLIRYLYIGIRTWTRESAEFNFPPLFCCWFQVWRQESNLIEYSIVAWNKLLYRTTYLPILHIIVANHRYDLSTLSVHYNAIDELMLIFSREHHKKIHVWSYGVSWIWLQRIINANECHHYWHDNRWTELNNTVLKCMGGKRRARDIGL